MDWKLLLVWTLFGMCRAESQLNCDNVTRHEVPGCLWGCPPERTCQNFRGPEPPCVPPIGPCKPQCVCADGYARNQYGGTCVTFEQCDKCPGYNQYFACDGPYSETCPGSCHCASGYERDANNVCVSTTPPPVDNHPSPPPVLPSPPLPSPPQPSPPIRKPLPPIRKPSPPLPSPPQPSPPQPSPPQPSPPQPSPPQPSPPQPSPPIRKPSPPQPSPPQPSPPQPSPPPPQPSPPIRKPSPPIQKPSPPLPSPPIRKPACRPKPVLTCDNVTRHEILACTWGCPPERTCQNRNWPPPPCARPDFPCTPKCICDHGYARNKPGGTCITLEQCDKCPGENEYFECDCDCDYSEDCTGHCYCFPNHVRDADGKCVYVDPAPPPVIVEPPTEPPKPVPTCDNVTRHEILACTWGCPPERTCQNRNWPPPPCARPIFPCTSKCICDHGYARNQPGGTCITLEQCDKCPGDNEYFACDCDYSEDCPGRCYCFPDHVRDADGKCVYVDPAAPPVIQEPPTKPQVLPSPKPSPPQPSPPQPSQPSPPQPSPPQPSPPQPSPPQPSQPSPPQPSPPQPSPLQPSPPQPSPPQPSQEPLTCNGTLREVSGCTWGCPPERTCQNRNWPPFPCAPPAFPCTQRCLCADGYTRSQPDGTCITEEQCDKCPGENEYFACDCDYSENCPGRCYCFPDHVRDADGKCVYVDPAAPPGILEPGASQ